MAAATWSPQRLQASMTLLYFFLLRDQTVLILLS
jgi:hypothetical protein